MGYFLINIYSPYVSNWVNSLEIASAFLNQKGVKGYSYNGYIGMGEPLAHFELRFNFENDEEGKKLIEGIIDNLIDRKLIIAKGEWALFARHPSVLRGTEIATKCALAFKNWMNAHGETLQYYVASPQNRIEFMPRFLAILLEKLGFKTFFEEYPLEDKIEVIKDCAITCSNQIKNDFKPPFDITFMERVLHHFFNCVHVDTSQEEPIIYNQIAYWTWLGNLAESKPKE
jgi:hypothetical protein